VLCSRHGLSAPGRRRRAHDGATRDLVTLGMAANAIIGEAPADMV
jgi:hypothetical protein